ncbi:MAG: helix-turn-helix domain-containing protein, partial [Chitinivibrionales bacterium]|nr:helix-turn-helix domain-containing protein [Chitinivibrionales bacterium]
MEALPFMMDKLTMPGDTDVSQVFRAPSRLERQLGLWVDRVGEKIDAVYPDRSRLLGLYGVVYVCEGRGRFESRAGGTHAVSAGQCMLLFPDDPHRYGACEGMWRTRWIVWGGERARTLHRLGYLDPRRPLVADRGGAVTRTHRALLPLMGAADPASCLHGGNLIHALVLELYRAQRAAIGDTGTCDRIRDVIAYLDAHYLEQPRPSELATRFAISYTHLRRLFRRATGESMKEYIIRKRISRAKELLLAGVRPIKRVAAAVGYEDEYYFMR